MNDLKQRREQIYLSRADIAKKLQCSYNAIYGIEVGRRGDGSALKLRYISLLTQLEDDFQKDQISKKGYIKRFVDRATPEQVKILMRIVTFNDDIENHLNS